MTFDGDYYRTERATVYDRPTSRFPSSSPPPDRWPPSSPAESATASSARAASSRSSTGSCSTQSPRAPTAAGRDAHAIVRMIEIKVSYDHDADYARDACRWWAALSLTPEEKMGVEDPVEMERLADAAADRAHTRFIVSDDADAGRRAEIEAYIGARLHAPRLPRAGRGPAPLPRAVLRRRRAVAALARAGYGELRLVGQAGEHLQLQLADTSPPRAEPRPGSPSVPGRGRTEPQRRNLRG